jgi:hypothetical protein
MVAMTMVGETEAWSIASNVICNSFHGVVWYFITRTPSLMIPISGKVAVWNSPVRIFLTSEFALVVAALALTYYLQSRKRDFI